MLLKKWYATTRQIQNLINIYELEQILILNAEWSTSKNEPPNINNFRIFVDQTSDYQKQSKKFQLSANLATFTEM